ncbi:MAG: FtsX-like permease family protein [Lachnospiraceae bacterium]|nr:FtsX-like permease family protein [Lachnospiraceae bacterium]
MINERKLAFKYLCKKKRRSLSTLFAIALSMFIVFVSGNLIMGAFYASKQAELIRNGNHIAYLEEMNLEQISALEKEGVVLCALENSTYFMGKMGMEDHEGSFGFYYFEDFSNFPFYYEVVQGKTPEKPGEIMINEMWKYFLGEDYEIGDTITVQLTGMELKTEPNQESVVTEENSITRTYTLAGYYRCPEYSWIEDGVVMVKDEPRKEGNTYRVYITSEEEGIEDIESVEGFEEKEDWARNLGEKYGAKVEVNWLFEKSQSEETAMGYCLVLIFAVFIGGFAAIVIRNSFVISIVERTRDYGMLRCIGASKRQIRKIAFYEAVMLGIAGEVIGLIVSYLFLYLVIQIGKEHISFLEEFKFVQRPVLIFGICLIVFLVVLFGLLEPTRQINKLNPLNALRNQKDVKKEKFRVKRRRGFLVAKLFGVEGEYAYKNLMRNRKRFITTTASCVVGVTFFIGTNAAFVYSEQMLEEPGIAYADYNAELYVHSWCMDSEDSLKEELESIKGISNITFCYQEFYRIDNESLKRKEDGVVVKTNYVLALDEGKYPIEKESVEKGEIGELKPGECYVINWGYDDEKKEIVEISDVSVGDKIQLHELILAEDESTEKTISELKVKAVLKEQPFANTYSYYPVLVMSKEGFQALCEEQGMSYEEYGKIHFKMDKNCDTSKVQELADKYGMLFFDEMKDAREAAEQMKMARLVVNAILILVALISSVNLFNSMESNNILREKERKIMRTVGMSKKQYRKMILLEGMLSVIIALILGTALGLAFGYGIYNIMVLTENELKFAVPVESIVFAGVGLTLLTVLSCMGGMKEE